MSALTINSATYLWEMLNVLFVERYIFVKSSSGGTVNIFNMQIIKKKLPNRLVEHQSHNFLS